MTRWILALCTVLSIEVTDARAASIQLAAANQTVSPGDAVSLDLLVSGLAGSVVGDFDVDVTYDSTRLTLDGFTLSGALGAMPGQALDFSLGIVVPGVLNLAVVSTLTAGQLDILQGDPVLLATLAFTVGSLPGGQSTVVGLTLNAIGGGAGGALPITALDGATLTAVDQPQTPQGVPEPMTGVLCLTGVMWLARNSTKSLNQPINHQITKSPNH